MLIEIVSGECGAERSSGIARGGLDPDAVKSPIPHEFAIGDTVESDSSGQTQILQTRLLRQRTRHPEDHFFEDGLNRSSHIHMPLRHQLIRLSRWPAEQGVEP